MGYYTLTEDMAAAIGMVVEDEEVWDLGAGHDPLSLNFLSIIRRLNLVEKENYFLKESKKVKVYNKYFIDLDIETLGGVAILSWPSNNRLQGLVPLLRRFHTIVYLGKNNKYSVCGNFNLYTYLISREPLFYVPHPQNDLIIYSRSARNYRLLSEESAALEIWGGEQ